MLWDDTDKTYGYVNNYTGEVTFKYPTTQAKPKVVDKVEPTFSMSSPNAKSQPWKNNLDGSITGTLGGERKKPVPVPGQAPTESFLSQTDILKDKLISERVTNRRAGTDSGSTTPTTTTQRPIKNEIKDRRLARLGIQIDPIVEEEPVKPVISVIPDIEKESENEDGKSDDTLPAEPQFHAAEGNMEISDDDDADDDESDRRERKRKKRKRDKTTTKGQKVTPLSNTPNNLHFHTNS